MVEVVVMVISSSSKVMSFGKRHVCEHMNGLNRYVISGECIDVKASNDRPIIPLGLPRTKLAREESFRNHPRHIRKALPEFSQIWKRKKLWGKEFPEREHRGSARK